MTKILMKLDNDSNKIKHIFLCIEHHAICISYANKVYLTT